MAGKDISKNTEDSGKNRREWVKNVIIVFLLIMLLLTFFSNTIMNYSLPEVSVTRIGRDKVSKSYTADLTVEANKTYLVTAEENRDIKRVAVKRGQEVKEGQTLFFLTEVKDSREARELQEQIDAARDAYEKALITVSKDYFELNQAVQIARDKLNQAINDRNNAPSAPSVNPAETAKLRERKSALSSDIGFITEKNWDLVSSETSGKFADEYTAFSKTEGELEAVQAECGRYQEIITNAGAENGTKELERNISNLKISLEQIKNDPESAGGVPALEAKIKYAEEDLAEVKEAIASLEKAKTDLAAKQAAHKTAKTAFERKITEVTGAVSAEIASIEAQLETMQGGFSGMTEHIDYDEAVRTAQYSLDAAVNALEKQMAADRVTDAQDQIDLEAQRKKIELFEQDMEKLVSKQTATEIKAPVDGVVEEIMALSGQSVMENDELMKLNISDDGFTATIQVTAEQARSLQKGKAAKIDGRDKVTAVVKNITKDKADSAKFTVTFTVEGNVTAGQVLKAELGDSPASFDRVIPRNAVKKDSTGSFVYVVKSKSTPLGNRYIVDKVSVTVQAEDDTQCAVSGDFGDSADYIITASSKPFSAGDQVRFAQE